MRTKSNSYAGADFKGASPSTGIFQVMGFLVGIGIAISGYMAYTDVAGASLVCGGIGDCDTVHASTYARLLGVPVSLLGLGAYAAVAGLHFARPSVSQENAYLMLLAQMAVAVAGALFSAYLTYVEFFIIAAVCPWCVASAVVIVALAGLSIAEVLGEVRRSDQRAPVARRA